MENIYLWKSAEPQREQRGPVTFHHPLSPSCLACDKDLLRCTASFSVHSSVSGRLGPGPTGFRFQSCFTKWFLLFFYFFYLKELSLLQKETGFSTPGTVKSRISIMTASQECHQGLGTSRFEYSLFS
jgi:hypothetical protein